MRSIYYLFALIFLAFDVDVLFLFPVLLAYGKGYVWRDFIEVIHLYRHSVPGDRLCLVQRSV